MAGFFNLERLGHYYDCRQRTWFRDYHNNVDKMTDESKMKFC